MAVKTKGKAIGWKVAMSKCLARARRKKGIRNPKAYCAAGLRRTGIAKYGKKGFIAKMKAGKRAA